MLNGVDVAITKEQQTIRPFAIAAGAADLLVIALHILRQINMQDKAHIRFIDAHAKGNRRHNHPHIVNHKGALIARARAMIQPSMIRQRLQAVGVDRRGQILDMALGGTVDNPRLVGMGLQEVDHLLRHVGLGLHADKEVGPVEAGEKFIFIAETERLFDIFLHTRGRGGGQGQANRIGKTLAHGHNFAIFRAEIMTPL